MKAITLKIKDIHCDSCVKVITMGLEELSGIEKIEINQRLKTGQIVFDEDKISIREILESIKESGYKAELID